MLNGEPFPTLSILKHSLKHDFEHIGTRTVPRLEREHDRRAVLSLMEVSLWRKTSSTA